MRKIVIENSMSKIVGLTRSQLAALRKEFSYVDFDVLKFQQFPKVIHAIDRYGNFGTGLVPKVLTLFKTHNISIEVDDQRIKPGPKNHNIKLKKLLEFDPYPEQIEIANRIESEVTGSAILPTGTGKSIVSVLSINEVRRPTIIITPNLNLKVQLYNDLKELFGPNRVNMLSKSSKMREITIANIQSLDSFPDDIFKDKEFLIIDEWHFAAAESYIKANKDKFKSCYYRLFLSATPYRNDGRQNIFLDSFCTNIMVNLRIEEAIDKGYIIRPYFNAVEVSHTEKEIVKALNWRSTSDSKNEYHAIRSILVNESETYIKKVCDVIKLNSDKKTVVLVDHLDIIDKICNELKKDELYNQNQLLEPKIVTGLTDKNQKIFNDFNLGKVQLLIGSSCIGTGVNLKPVECLIVTTPIKSKPFTIQQWGRGLRKSGSKTSCEIYWFDIVNHAIFKNQMKARREYALEFGKYGTIKDFA